EEAEVPRRERGIAVGVANLTEAAHVGGPSPDQEVIQDLSELRRCHALVLEKLQREVVVVSQRSCKTIAQFHEIQKTIGQHPLLDLVKGVERAAAAILYGIGRLIC